MTEQEQPKFSFLKLFNHLKYVSRELPLDMFDPDWLAKKASKAQQEKFKRFFAFCEKHKIEAPKVKYPVLFGKSPFQYPGMLATQDIGQNEVFVRVPSKCLINTKDTFECPELSQVYDDNPQLYGVHTDHGIDNVYYTYLLYQFGLGEKSFFYDAFQILPSPEEADILVNWDEEDLEWL